MKVLPENPWLRLVIVWISMLALVGISVGVAIVYPHIGIWHSVINLTIGGVLVFLVMTFYMHLETSGTLMRLFASAGFFWLIILFTLGLADYFSRYSI